MYRHSGYWYMGDLGPWPPETHYRCIKGCEHGLDVPPLTMCGHAHAVPTPQSPLVYQLALT